jgi:hypothetical protein
MSGSVVTIRGQRKLFHANKKAKMPRAAKAGLDNGKKICRQICNLEQPSIRALSSSSLGKVM